ncbi:MAG: hypothetical protein AB4352_27925 [Hormoscilla sp.]
MNNEIAFMAVVVDAGLTCYNQVYLIQKAIAKCNYDIGRIRNATPGLDSR